MPEVHVGRLLAASLHQAIAEELPMRLEFYENWLHSEGLRDGSIGLAPMQAVLGFLRTEGEAYANVMERAGRYAAEWALMSLPARRRRVVTVLPRWLRIRLALRLVRTVAGAVSTGSRVQFVIRGGRADVEFPASLFCAVRGVHAAPLCVFYRALVGATLASVGVPAVATVAQCRATGAGRCLVTVDVSVAAQPEAALGVA